MTDTSVTRFAVRGAGSMRQASLEIPLGSTSTGWSGPAMRRMGSAATSLTAESTTGQLPQPLRRSSRANPGAAYPHTQCSVMTLGTPARWAARAAM